MFQVKAKIICNLDVASTYYLLCNVLLKVKFDIHGVLSTKFLKY